MKDVVLIVHNILFVYLVIQFCLFVVVVSQQKAILLNAFSLFMISFILVISSSGMFYSLGYIYDEHNISPNVMTTYYYLAIIAFTVINGLTYLIKKITHKS